MVNIYQVKGRVFLGEYNESVKILEDMEEKPKSYVGLGRRINKQQINNIEEGTFRDSFQIHVLNESDIKQARLQIYEKVKKNAENEFEKAKGNLKAVNEYDLSKDIKIKEY